MFIIISIISVIIISQSLAMEIVDPIEQTSSSFKKELVLQAKEKNMGLLLTNYLDDSEYNGSNLGHAPYIKNIVQTQKNINAKLGIKDDNTTMYNAIRQKIPLINTQLAVFKELEINCATPREVLALIAANSYQEELKTLQCKSFYCTKTLSEESSDVAYLALNTTGTKLISGSHARRTLTEWDLMTGTSKKIARNATSWIDTFVLGSDDTTLIYVEGKNRNIKGWDLNTDSEIPTPGNPGNQLGGLLLSRDNKTLLYGSTSNTIIIWNLLQGNLLKTLREHKDCITSLQLNAKETVLFSGSKDGSIILWDMKDGNPLKKIENLHCVNKVILNSDESLVFAIMNYIHIKICDIHTASLVKTLYIQATDATLTNDDTILFSSALDSIEICNIQHYKRLKLLNDPTQSIVIDRTMTTLFSSSRDNTIKIWKPAFIANTKPLIQSGNYKDIIFMGLLYAS